jgi:hypothetical protein
VPLGVTTDCPPCLHQLDPADAVAAVEVAVRFGARQLWIGPAAARQIGLPERLTAPRERQDDPWRWGEPHPWVDALVAAGWTTSTEPAGLGPWFGLRRGDVWIDIVIPDDENPFRAATSGRELLGALDLYAHHVGMRYRRSPGATGVALMRRLDAFDQVGDVEPPAPALDPEPAQPAVWLALDPEVPPWLHSYDTNASWLGACSSLYLGLGRPVHRHGAPDGPFDPEWPGYWRARIEGPHRFPLPFWTDGRPHWYTSPSLALAREVGLRVEVMEAWTYPERRRALRPWYERLRDARSVFMELAGGAMGEEQRARGRLALAACKATYTRALGWLRGGWLAPGAPEFRPDWHDSVISKGHANVHRHIHRTWRQHGAAPLGLEVDLVIYGSSEPDPLAAAARLALPLSRQVGKFKPAASMPGEQLAALLAAEEDPELLAAAVLGRMRG